VPSHPLYRWRAEVASLDDEETEYVLPTILIERLLQTQSNLPPTDVVQVAWEVLKGYVPDYVERYKDKISALLVTHSEVVAGATQTP
jgi:hypothetical protein